MIQKEPQTHIQCVDTPQIYNMVCVIFNAIFTDKLLDFFLAVPRYEKVPRPGIKLVPQL